jgi:hypothetical protein
MGIERVVFDGIGIYLNILTISLIKFSFPTKMDLYLFNSVGYSKLYNCSGYNVTDIPIEKRQDVGAFLAFPKLFIMPFLFLSVWGILFIIMFVLYEVFLMPILGCTTFLPINLSSFICLAFILSENIWARLVINSCFSLELSMSFACQFVPSFMDILPSLGIGQF